MRHFFIMPTLNCPASCKYCFSSDKQSPVMPLDMFSRSIELFQDLSSEADHEKVEICFHGGEPLLAGVEFYKSGLAKIRDIFGASAKLSIQSNLWMLNENFCELFSEYNVKIGTSLDGPEEINDYQRSRGYYKKTMKGINLLREQGMGAGCIASFSKCSAKRAEEILDFFIADSMPFSVHAAVKPMDYEGTDDLFMLPAEFGKFLITLLKLYLDRTDKIKISTLDTMIKNVSRDKSGLCTFTRCLGEYIAVGPKGELYPCNRFVGDERFSFGNVDNISSISDIKKSEGWERLTKWQEQIDSECSDCLHKNICHGGCPYSGFASGNGKIKKDPYCEAYKMVYKYILDRGTEEFLSEKNITDALKTEGGADKSAFFKGTPLLHIMSDDPHPYELTAASKRIVAAGMFGATNDPEKTADIFNTLNLTKTKQGLYPRFQKIYDDLKKESTKYNNLYLHITNRCQLSCDHCYAKSGQAEVNHFPLKSITPILLEAKELQFQKTIITGGEPLLHPDFTELLSIILELKKNRQCGKIVLRTNLAAKRDPETFRLMEKAFDQIIISLDGSEDYHNMRRGEGAYQKTVSNLGKFSENALQKKIQITSVFNYKALTSEEIKIEKDSVNQIKGKYNINDVRFRPLLPIGRAKSTDATPPKMEKIGVSEWVRWKYYPRTSCGLGQVIMIEPNGNAYPCHVFSNSENLIGNVLYTSIADLVKTDKYMALKKITVDSDEKCKECNLRYLCGGSCKIWSGNDCSDLYDNARYLFKDALRILNISEEQII